MVRTAPPPPPPLSTPLPPLSVKRLVTAFKLSSPTPDARLVHVEIVDGDPPITGLGSLLPHGQPDERCARARAPCALAAINRKKTQ